MSTGSRLLPNNRVIQGADQEFDRRLAALAKAVEEEPSPPVISRLDLLVLR
jgi:hypothetical protein